MELPRIALAILENPFYVLGVSPECTRHEFEREGQRLLAMLALDLAEVKKYSTPLGDRVRTPELILRSIAELRNPTKRLQHEVIATLPSSDVRASHPTPIEAEDRWLEAPGWFGYGWYRQERK
jgi:hypothetical protein